MTGHNSWVNGSPSTSIPLNDRGLAYGDGLFETITFRGGKSLLLNMHLERLKHGCQRLAIAVDFAKLRYEIAMASNGIDNALIKVVITRQAGQRGYFGAKGAPGNRMIQRLSLPLSLDKSAGIALRFCTTRLGINPQLAGLKHLNRLEQVLARSEWSSPEYYEGVMMDAEGFVIEGTMTNVFFQHGEQWVTPCLERCGVSGVYRRFVIECLAPIVLSEVQVKPVSKEELLAAPAAFVCNSVQGIVPVEQLADSTYSFTPELRALLSAEAHYSDA